MTAFSSIGHLDRCRRLPTKDRSAPGPGFKEWHHVVVHDGDLQLLINVSETVPSREEHATTRSVVMVHTDRWHNSVVHGCPRRVSIRDDILDAAYGDGTRIWWERDHYRILVEDSAHPCTIDLRLDPLAEPSMLTGVTLSSSERLSWFFVPRLRASGTVTMRGQKSWINGAVAYHDHNWGHFDWGGNYSWEWMSGLAPTWSVTASRLLDGHQTRLLSQYMHVECDGASETFRDAEITCHHHGRRRLLDVPVVPAPMALVAPSPTEDVPEQMTWTARRGSNEIEYTVTTGDVARLVIPSERRIDGVVVLAEVLGTVDVQGVIQGVELRGTGQVILELLR